MPRNMESVYISASPPPPVKGFYILFGGQLVDSDYNVMLL
jgi:hypothetical protein